MYFACRCGIIGKTPTNQGPMSDAFQWNFRYDILQSVGHASGPKKSESKENTKESSCSVNKKNRKEVHATRIPP